ncbi:MAG: hypothetical protein PHQ75_08895, partial [Thermoguttaceae bacterium]|nr:hypothetical protein [Thermoguttaceae bacterium]
MKKSWRLRLKTTFCLTIVTLSVCCVVYFAYAMLVVPQIIVKPVIPPPTAVSGTASPNEAGAGQTSVLSKFESHLKILFPGKNDWRTHKPSILQPKSGQGLVLFRNEPVIGPDRREIKLDACTFIIFPTDASLDEEERYRQAIVIETSDNASVTFKTPLGSDMQPDLNHFEKAELRGQVIIRCAGKTKQADDDFRLETRDVLLSLTQIYTKNPVVFQCGRQNGDGEELRISLKMRSLFPSKQEETPNPMTDIQRELAEGNVREGISITSIELKHLNRLQFPLGLIVKSNKGDQSSPIAGQEQKKIDELTPVDIRCKNGFRFAPHPEEPASWVGRFMENVEVIVLNRDTKHDCLKCKNLYIHFIDPVLEQMIASSTVPLKDKKLPVGKFERLEPYKIKADRSEEAPTEISSPQNNFKAQGDRLIYDFREKSILIDALDPAQRVRLEYNSITIQSSSICYRGGKDNSFVSLVAGKNGQLDASVQQGNAPTRFRASWKEALHVIPTADDANKLQISGKGGIDFFLDGLGTIASEEVDFWGTLRDPKKSLPGSASLSSPNETANFSSFTPKSAQFLGNIQLNSFGARGNIRNNLTVRFHPKQVGQTPDTGGGAPDTGGGGPAGKVSGPQG